MCSNDGFSVGIETELCHGSLVHDGPRGLPGWCLVDGMDVPKTCGKRDNKVVVENECKKIDGCNWFNTAVEDTSNNLYKCKSLQDLYYDPIKNNDNCSSVYKENILNIRNGDYEEKDYGHTLPLNVYWYREYDTPPSACEQFNVCLPQDIEYIGWEDTDWFQPCKNECDGTHTPFVYENSKLVDRTSGWEKLGEITQSDLGKEDAGCFLNKKELENYDGCTFSRRALCVKKSS